MLTSKTENFDDTQERYFLKTAQELKQFQIKTTQEGYREMFSIGPELAKCLGNIHHYYSGDWDQKITTLQELMDNLLLYGCARLNMEIKFSAAKPR